MKAIGMIGGMSWQSTIDYYRIINETVEERLGGFHSASIILSSIDFDRIMNLVHGGEWGKAGKILADEAKRLEGAGADIFLICNNTMHKVADDFCSAVGIPFLHIVDAAAGEIRKAGLNKVGLLGTRFTMEDGFYQGRLGELGIEAVTPGEADRAIVDRVIFGELVKGDIRDSSRDEYMRIVGSLVDAGAEGIVLGCTEIPLLIKQEDLSCPLFDTTRIHSIAAVEMAMGS